MGNLKASLYLGFGLVMIVAASYSVVTSWDAYTKALARGDYAYFLGAIMAAVFFLALGYWFMVPALQQMWGKK